MKTIVLHISISEEMKLKGVTFTYNDTGLQSGKDLLESISVAILNSVEMDKHQDDVNELLSKLNIKKIGS